LGWTDGSNVQIDQRWGAGDAERSRKYAAELVTLSPDIMLASGDPIMAVHQATRTVPIVFTIIADPVGAGLVDRRLARPGGNVTGLRSARSPLSDPSVCFRC
jgi:putative ABC transport system substrate-binding protein